MNQILGVLSIKKEAKFTYEYMNYFLLKKSIEQFLKNIVVDMHKLYF